jgi:hypothetical protein
VGGRSVPECSAGHLSIDEGRLHLGVQEFRLGNLSVPAILLRMLSSSVYAMLMDDPQIRRIIEAIVTMNTEPGAINFVFQSGALSQQVVPALVASLERSDAFETELYLRHLIAVYNAFPRTPIASAYCCKRPSPWRPAGQRSKIPCSKIALRFLPWRFSWDTRILSRSWANCSTRTCEPGRAGLSER